MCLFPQDFMPRVFTFNLRNLLVASLIVFGFGQAAQARNIPGSAQLGVSHATEVATGMIVRSLKDNMRQMRDDGASVQISTSGDMELTGVRASTGGISSLTFSLERRDVDMTDLTGSIDVSTLLFGHHVNEQVLVFGGLIGERGNLVTPYNTGTIKYDGAGLALGLDYRVSNQMYLTAIVGGMSLDYDVTRGGGAISGSFGANRQFIDLSGDYLTRAGNADLRFGAGLLYATQKNDGYTESGGAVVGAVRQDQLSAKVEMRSTWGVPGDFRPFVDLSAWGKLSGNDAVPAVFGTTLNDGVSARMAVGVERVHGASSFNFAVGANFGSDRFEGLDAKLNYSFRF